jgi:hypothetical protein
MSTDRLYDLLPVIERLRDSERGQPLRALLQVIAEQVDVVENDIAQLYENWFIETCEEWAVPYIAELLGYRVVHEAGEPGAATTAQGQRRNSFLIPRREVANTIRYRRRKGTLALLELLCADTAGWPARAVEFFQLLGLAQHTHFSAIERGRTANLRQGNALDRIDGPFDEVAHTVDVRRLGSTRTRGRYSIPGVGLFVWRLKPYSITRAPAYSIDRARFQYTFSMLGNDMQLFTLPIEEPAPSQIAGELNVPAPIRRHAFDERTIDYYGPGKSLQIWRDSFERPVPHDLIVAADLSDWTYRPQGDQVAVDPVLGRIVFSPRTAPKTGVWVSYHYGFSDDVGGGEYDRPLRPVGDRKLYQVSTDTRAQSARAAAAVTTSPKPYSSIKEALAAWSQDAPVDAVIEILDSGVYVEQIEIQLAAGQRLELRAANRKRPVFRLLDFYTNRPDAMQIRGPEELAEGQQPARFTLDGVLVTGRGLQISGKIREVGIRHSTLVPGWAITHECEPEDAEEPSLELLDTSARLTVDHSIVGTIRVSENEVGTDPISIIISDSILDATSPNLDALDSPIGRVAHARLTVLRSTVFGRVSTHAIDLAENAIFEGVVRVARRQIGCMRFCYVSPGSRTPRRYNCQPDLVVYAVPEGQDSPAAQRERSRVRPQFNSVRYGTPTYCQLAEGCAPEIKQGADDESEMGVFHDLFQPQREANLRARIDEFTPAGMDAGIIFAT